MRKLVGRAVTHVLPESTLYTLVRLRHREFAWQRRRDFGRGGPLGHDGPPGSPASDSEQFGRVVRRRGVRSLLVSEFDAHSVRDANVRAVSRALEQHGVAHALVPNASTSGDGVAVSAEDRPAALRALARVLSGPEWAVEPSTEQPPDPLTARQARPLRTLGAGAYRNHHSLRVFRVLASAGGDLVAGADLACVLSFWQPVEAPGTPRPDGGTFAIGTRLSPLPLSDIVAYLSPASWQAATSAPGHWPVSALRSTLFHVREPIDIVYTWVDGDDPLWLARKAACFAGVDSSALNDTAVHMSRFESRNELRYSLRSVAAYASWVRKIYIVTDAQIPPWLDTSHPKVEVIDHRQIFADQAVLPVFNSHAIESQLHHIPGLAEHYLYLNDDVFFGRPVEPELFFNGNGIGKFFLSKARLDIDSPTSQDLPVMSAAKRNREFIERHFGATVINKFKHTPHPQLRSVLEEMESAYPEVFATVARSRFRHPDDLSITSALHHYYAYGIGRAMPAAIRYAYQDIGRPDTARRLSNLARLRDYDVFCLNDHETAPEDFQTQARILGEFFERYFPIPSPYELSDAQHRATVNPEAQPADHPDDAGVPS
jgi:Stealth protein CR2, conserved region 2/Stealth protein CR3, conserved region 3/Stealth protein CR4, conserved region 4/Stealth protein CR1, conserved region 1